jgi:sugar lactone lactonase YvrE
MLLAVILLTGCGSGQGSAALPGDAGSSVAPPVSGPQPGTPSLPAEDTRPVTGTISLFAGTDGGEGSRDGTGMQARFNRPAAAVADASGNLFVADTGNHVIRKVAPDGSVTTIAGKAGEAGYADGAAEAARFDSPAGLVVDGHGGLFVADTANHLIRHVASDGRVSTVAGSPRDTGRQDGTGANARFSSPVSLTVDRQGNLYVADTGNLAVRKVAPGGVVSTIIRTGRALSNDADGPVESAGIGSIGGLTVDPAGNLYFAQTDSHTIRMISVSGVVTTLAGQPSNPGKQDGTGRNAQFSSPRAMSIDQAGNVYVLDGAGKYGPGPLSAEELAQSTYTAIRRISPGGAVTTLPVKGTPYDQSGLETPLDTPAGIAFDAGGNLIVTDAYAVRRLGPGGVLSTVAGKPYGAGRSGKADANAAVTFIAGLAVDASGNVYVIPGNSVYKLASNGEVMTFGPRREAAGMLFQSMDGIAVDPMGNVYVSDGLAPHFISDGNVVLNGNNQIQRIAADGAVTTVAGERAQIGSADGPGSTARFYGPKGLVADKAGNVYVADQLNHTIRRIAADGAVSTFAGTAGSAGSNDGPRMDARFSLPTALAMDAAGNLYVADTGSFTVRKVGTDGMVSTIAGMPGTSGDADGIGQAARLRYPSGIAVDGKGYVYVVDQQNNAVRRISPSGHVRTILRAPSQNGMALSQFDGRFPGAISPPLSVASDGGRTLYVGTVGALFRIDLSDD